MGKYEFTDEIKVVNGIALHRIKAITDFGNVKAGELGGFIKKRANLSDEGNAWVYGNAEVSGNAEVYGDARVFGNAEVSDNAEVFGDARVCGDARVYGDARVCDNAEVCGDADYICIKGLGSEYRNTTFYNNKKGGVSVCCGCFYGTLDEFAAKVKETHADNVYAKEYLAAVEVVKIHFGIKDD